MVKTYVLDTNVLLTDSDCLFAFDDNELIIPLLVLEELDRHKNRADDVGKNARQISRTLDALRQQGSNLITGVKLPNGGFLRIAPITAGGINELPQELGDSKVDNMIILFMLKMKQNADCILVSKDINVRLKCDALGILSEDYKKMRVTDDTKKLYRGVTVVEVDDDVIDSFFETESVLLTPEILKNEKLFPNQIVVMKSVKNGQTIKSAISKCLSDGPTNNALVVPVKKVENAFGLKARNKEQGFSLDLLFDENVKLLTLTGQAGCGKSILAIAAGLEQLRGVGNPSVAKYDKMIVLRPVQPVGKDIGFLPGTMQEKMEPWISPIKDNFGFLMNGNRSNSIKRKTAGKIYDDNAYFSLMQEKGLIEIEAITFIRGRSIPNAFLLIDEAQNLTAHELKTIVTRVSEGTKVVLTGDIEQIDNSHVDAFTNGLTYAVEKFKDYPIAGHITLLKGERSPLATLASKIL
jgi:PhoH-like ATPase